MYPGGFAPCNCNISKFVKYAKDDTIDKNYSDFITKEGSLMYYEI